MKNSSKKQSNNQLVQACRIYLECDFILIGLKVLYWFTFKVTMPFLNMVELSTQKDLDILPKLHDDHSAGVLDRLSEYIYVNFDYPAASNSLVGVGSSRLA